MSFSFLRRRFWTIVGCSVVAYATWALFCRPPDYLGSPPYEEVESIVQELYEGVSGFEIPEKEKEFIAKSSSDGVQESQQASVYGEITHDGIRTMLDELQLTQDDVFYDLGSGVGKLAITIYLATAVDKSVGIELSETRYKQARNALEILREDKRIAPHRALEFRHTNMLEVDLNDATVVYACSTLFPQALMKKLTNKIVSIPHPVRVVTLKKLVDHERLLHTKTFFVNTTWSPDVPAYVYETGSWSAVQRSSRASKLQALDPREVQYFMKDLYLHKPLGSATAQLPFESVRAMLDVLHLKRHDVFYAFGSDMGQQAIQVHLSTPVGKYVGIERSEPHHNVAVEVLQKLRSSVNVPQTGKTLEFRNAKKLSEISLNDASVVYVPPGYFTKPDLDKLTEKIAQVRKSVKLVVFSEIKHSRFEKKDQLEVEILVGSKLTTAALYVYANSLPYTRSRN